MKEAVQHCATRPLPPPREPFMWLSGLEDLVVTKERFQFLNVGERYARIAPHVPYLDREGWWC